MIEEDDKLVQQYRPEDQSKYRLFYQLTRITKDRGALAHDDRLDALAGAVQYWVEHMALDQKKAAEKAREKDFKSELAAHIRDQVGAVTDPFKASRRSRKDGMVRAF